MRGAGAQLELLNACALDQGLVHWRNCPRRLGIPQPALGVSSSSNQKSNYSHSMLVCDSCLWWPAAVVASCQARAVACLGLNAGQRGRAGPRATQGNAMQSWKRAQRQGWGMRRLGSYGTMSMRGDCLGGGIPAICSGPLVLSRYALWAGTFRFLMISRPFHDRAGELGSRQSLTNVHMAMATWPLASVHRPAGPTGLLYCTHQPFNTASGELSRV